MRALQSTVLSICHARLCNCCVTVPPQLSQMHTYLQVHLFIHIYICAMEAITFIKSLQDVIPDLLFNNLGEDIYYMNYII